MAKNLIYPKVILYEYEGEGGVAVRAKESDEEHSGIRYMPEGAWAYILGASPVTALPSMLASPAKVGRSRQEISGHVQNRYVKLQASW
uniref:Uncharacterized protein n=1 Tax=Candidatus Methanogaster sp. ANME-2c ERB4 TaxID=2759911 RepID=A0A7G9YAY3_9EURY|nr:hypothetical protein GMDKAGHH_00020 [Methanosarcinales archaeon ANME-2c ERB4]QNO46031.1 hypothetical protein OOGCPJEC_00016 [Methanosarcinales archaeon ANME-2c ERB4]